MRIQKMNSSAKTQNINKRVFADGMRDGIPIGLGYFAVSFSLGVTARNTGLNAFQAFLTSLLCNSSTGEYAAFSLMSAGAAYIEIALITLIANARYILMSCALSQRMRPDSRFGHRLLMSYDICDEIFGITIARPGYINPYYTYGAVLVASPCWAIGTSVGLLAGNSLPLNVVSALKVALFGMFLAVIIPSARKDKIIAGLITVCFVLSYVCATLPVVSNISEGTRTIILTVVISSFAAILFPKKDSEKDGEEETK